MSLGFFNDKEVVRDEDNDVNGKDDEEEVTTQTQLYQQLGKHLNFKGLPIESREYSPLMLLVPHMCSHGGDKSVSFVQIVATISKIQVISYFRSKETVNEFSKSYAKENKIQNRQLNKDVNSMSTIYQES